MNLLPLAITQQFFEVYRIPIGKDEFPIFAHHLPYFTVG